MNPLIRTPPQNLEAELALLAAIFHNNSCYEKVADILLPVHFAHPLHGYIYDAIGSFIRRGHMADPITLRDHFKSAPEAAEYLNQIAASLVNFLAVESYAKVIRELYLRRQLIEIGEDIVHKAHICELEESAHEQIEQAEQRLFELATQREIGKEGDRLSSVMRETIEIIEAAYKQDSSIVGVATGFRDMDQALGGLRPSNLVILAGRPSMGKTALATNIAFNAAAGGTSVAFFSLEMSKHELCNRILAQESKIPVELIHRGGVKAQDFETFNEIQLHLEINGTPLTIFDMPVATVAAVRAGARRLARKEGLGLIVIDYLQLLQPPAGKRSFENRVQEISEISRSLKALAKELNVPVLALSQLSRAVEQREDKRPQLADLRESGSIEQDADVVMFVFREEYYEARREPAKSTDKHLEWQKKIEALQNLAEVIIAKHRQGRMGNIKLYWDEELTKFGDLAQDGFIS